MRATRPEIRERTPASAKRTVSPDTVSVTRPLVRDGNVEHMAQ